MKKTLPLIIFCLTVVLVASAAALPTCALCGKQIQGKYVKFDDGQIFCLDCMDKYTHCDICGKPAIGTIKVDDKNVCRSCLAKLDRCSFCGNPIAGHYTYFRKLDLKLCDQCAKTVPRCDICGRPDNNLVTVGNKHICQKCLSTSLFCYSCGEPIQGDYTWFDGDKSRKYCSKCVATYPPCADCGAPAGPDMVKLDDGRVLCHECGLQALFDPQQVKTIKNKVLDYLKTSFGMVVTHDIKYSLQGKDFIGRKSAGISGDINGLFYKNNDTFSIYVLYGLRRKDLYQVIAHEIAHAWAAENCREDLDIERAEGFAQWIAYYALGNFGFADYRDILLHGNSVYVTGLKKMLALEKTGGREAVFNSLK